MILSALFEKFVQQSPISVMARGTLEHALAAEDIDQLFANAADRQYTRTLLFSTLVDLMSSVVCRIRPSIHAAYQADPSVIGVSIRAVYDKLNPVELGTTEAVVAHTAAKLGPVIRRLRGRRPKLLPGYQVRILDGNHLAASDRRLGVLRGHAAGPLPGHALVVFDPDLGLITRMIGFEDGHAQERLGIPAVLSQSHAREVWVADRNFCTTGFLFGLDARRSRFVIRQHGSLSSVELLGKIRPDGRCSSGRVWKQKAVLSDASGSRMTLRRVTVTLDVPSRGGETEVHILTNLSDAVSASKVAEMYRSRWRIETAFAEMEKSLSGEIRSLGQPRAALFGFGLALAAANVLAAVQAAVAAAHPKSETEISGYYLADELAGTSRGMMIAIDPASWSVFGGMCEDEFVRVLRTLAKGVKVSRYRKHRRGPKKPQPPRTQGKPHLSTARLLAARKKCEK